MNIDPTKFKLIETRIVEHDNYLPSIIIYCNTANFLVSEIWDKYAEV